jgi:hypothetical protein
MQNPPSHNNINYIYTAVKIIFNKPYSKVPIGSYNNIKIFTNYLATISMAKLANLIKLS